MLARLLVVLVAASCGRIGFGQELALDGWSESAAFEVVNPTAEELYDVPILVRLDPTNIDYARAAIDGRDLRFTDRTGMLAHEIERWDPSDTSIIWVRVPVLAAAPARTPLSMHYGNSMVTGISPEATWSSDHVAVYHFAGDTRDSTSTGLDASGVDTTTSKTALLGDSLALSPTGPPSYAVVPHQPILDEVLTYSGWIRSATPTIGRWEAMITQGIPDIELNPIHVGLFEDKVYFEVYDDSGSTVQRTHEAVPIGTWVHLAVAIGPTSVATFVDGTPRETLLVPNGARRSPQAMFFGADCDTCSLGAVVARSDFLDGNLDELRLERVVRSEAWFQTQVASMRDLLIEWQ
ncbi:MAG: DUF2341 domain-containing protein [Kofleriaceae bacterium]